MVEVGSQLSKDDTFTPAPTDPEGGKGINAEHAGDLLEFESKLFAVISPRCMSVDLVSHLLRNEYVCHYLK